MSQDLIKAALEDGAVGTYVRLLRAAETLRGEVTLSLGDFGLTGSQFSAMKVLRLKGPLAQRDIARYLLMASGNVTVVIDNLEKRGLVKRVRNAEDRRMVFVHLTGDGEKLFDEVYPGHLERIRAVMGRLNEEQVGDLHGLLDVVDPREYEPLCQTDEEREREESMQKSSESVKV